MQARSHRASARSQRGVTLIIALIMLVIIGLTAGAAMRSAVSSEKVINNMRSEALAQQYAEAGLRYCEEQLKLPSADRLDDTLKDTAILVTPLATPKWKDPTTWTGTARTRVPVNQYSNPNSSYTPAERPQCFVEKQILPDGKAMVLVTARGFSPDYKADGAGNTVAGSVVWLQTQSAFN